MNEQQLKIINKLPTPSDMIDKEVYKMFTAPNLIDKAMPFILLTAWIAILCSILFS